MSDNSQLDSQLLPAVSSFLSSPKQLLIDGEWRDASSGKTQRQPEGVKRSETRSR